MSLADSVQNDYFEWMVDLMCGHRFSKNISYRKLFMLLHTIEFKYFVPNDVNRAQDGINLRYKYAYLQHNVRLYDLIPGPCSVLEMIVALAVRCEEQIMDDTRYGDRTAQWFWVMINNLGLGSMTDDRFDKNYIYEVVRCFMDRQYEPNGKGGLFTIRNGDTDLRKKEIWYQLCEYLNSIM